MKISTATITAALTAFASADVYLHNPRGANDRCDEKSNNRDNNERLYDTENNAAGGYAWCPEEMRYFEGTKLNVEFYSQHSCGNGMMNKNDPDNLESTVCQHVIQIGCDHTFKQFAGKEASTYRLTDGVSLGRPLTPNDISNNNVYETFGDTCTETRPTWEDCENQPANDDTCDNLDLSNNNDRNTFNGNTCECSKRKMATYGWHEPEHYYRMCYSRERNKGLFTANRNINEGKGATATRQEQNSERYGFECTEERDYYPYWHPSPWMDLAIFASNTSRCAYFQTESQNVKERHHCIDPNDLESYDASKFNQELSCINAGFQWTAVPSWDIPAPECLIAPSQRDNRLGNVDARGDAEASQGEDFAHFDWWIPEYLIPDDADEARCVIRLRYNISTLETLDTFDQGDNVGKIETDPVNTVGSYAPKLDENGDEIEDEDDDVSETMPVRMSINTAQFGRTFEDRTQVFRILRRTEENNGAGKGVIHNLNVRGKRGNIAQVRNCVEYDFVPLVLHVAVGDWVHFQFCGSDYNNNGNAGQGRQGTDRSNVVEIYDYERNLPRPLNDTESIFSTDDTKILTWLGQKKEHCFSTKDMLGKEKNEGNEPESCHFLNGVRDSNGIPTAYFSHMAQVQKGGVFKYMSSRNNSFTNRSQKAVIIAGGNSTTALVVGVTLGVIGGVVLLGIGAFAIYKFGSFGSFSSNNRV